MELEFTGRHTDVTPAVKKHAEEHLNKRLIKILDSAPAKAHIILSVEKHRHIAEIVLSWRDHNFTGIVESEDMFTAITRAAEKIEKQVFKLKGKFNARKRSAASASQVAPQPVKPLAPAQPEPRIIRSRKYVVKPMTQEEAAQLVMDSPDQFLVFRDAETDRIGVIYKRADGNFGLIEP